jgi:SAM-dependent methyltransferase
MKQDAVSPYDLATLDKIPVIRRLIGRGASSGLALDIGSGTGYTTARVFNGTATVYLDSHLPNLQYSRDRAAKSGSARWLAASASVLPFASGSFDRVLCSEVLEHLEDDDAAVAEIARVLAPGGSVVITVPYSGHGFTSFLELCRIKTVHDYPGPEHHVRPGYDEASMTALLGRHGLEVEETAYYFRLFTRIAADAVSLAHILYQCIVHRRSAWTWSEATEAETGLAFQAYRWLFPVLRLARYPDRLLGRRRGFGLVVRARKAAASTPRNLMPSR